MRALLAAVGTRGDVQPATDHTWLAADAVLAPVSATPGRQVFQPGTWVLADRTPLPADLEACVTSV